MSSDDEEQIKSYLSHLAHEAEAPVPFRQIKRQADASRRRRQVALVALSACTVVAVGFGISRWSPTQSTQINVVGPASNAVPVTSRDAPTATTSLASPVSATSTPFPVTTTLLEPPGPFADLVDRLPWVVPAYETTQSGLPATYVVITTEGELRRIDTATGEVVTTYGVFPLGTDHRGMTGARLITLPGTSDILVATCCEPVSGNGYRISEPFLFEELPPAFVGTRVDVSPDGSMLVSGVPAFGVLVLDLESPGKPSEAATDVRDSAEVIWDPTQAAVIWVPSAVALSETFFLASEEKLVINRTSLATTGEDESKLQIVTDISLFNRSLAVGPDGTLLVAGCPTPTCASTLFVEVDLKQGTAKVVAEFDYVAGLGGFDPTGQAILATDTNGNLHLLTEDGDTVIATGIHWASW